MSITLNSTRRELWTHDNREILVRDWLNEAGLGPFEFVNRRGTWPDLVRRRDSLWVDVKTGGPNISVHVEAMLEYEKLERQGQRVIVVWAPTDDPRDWTANALKDLRRRQMDDVQPPRPGSTPWFKFRAGGRPITDWGPA